MVSGSVPILTSILLLSSLCSDVLSRRGGFGGVRGRWGGIGKVGGGHHYNVLHGNKGSSAGKIAGAAAAGALGGMVIGHGLGSMSRPGYGRYGGYGGGHRNSHYPQGAGFKNETHMEYYIDSASRGQTYSFVLLFGATVALLIGS